MDGEGMRTDALEQICRREKVAFVLCSPTAHNPTTITLSVERRQRLAELANIHSFLIIENDIRGMMPVRKQPSVFSLEQRKPIYVTGVPKKFAHGSRQG